MNDSYKTAVGILGTILSFELSDWSLMAGIAAGFMTAAWMFLQIAGRIREILAARRAEKQNENEKTPRD